MSDSQRPSSFKTSRAGWRRKAALSIAAALLALVAASSVTLERGRTLRIVDAQGAPVPGVLVAFHYEGRWFNPVHTATYRAGPTSLAIGSRGGVVEIAPSVHLHWPFPAEGSTQLIVDLLYAPSLHNGWATIVGGAVTREGISSVADDLASVTLHDLSDRPELWEGTLRNVSSVANMLLAERDGRLPGRTPHPDAASRLNELLGRFSQDYAAFMARHGETLRPRPQMHEALGAGLSDADRRAWEEMTDKSLQQEPRWGDLVSRLFADDVERFGQAGR